MYKFGITGTIGSGKSTVSLVFKENGIPIFDSDEYSKLCLTSGHPCFMKIIEVFGNSILTEERELNRKKLAQIIFQDESKRTILNNIVHPAIKQGMLDFFLEHSNSNLVGAEVPLLFECKWESLFDEIIVVTCSDKKAIERLIEYRNFTKSDAENRLKAQIHKEDQIQKADTVIYNEGTLVELNSVVRKWIEEKKDGIKD